jgi:hypothetical protein
MSAMMQTTLPPKMERFISRFVWRKRRAALFHSMGWAAAFTLGWLILECLADRVLHFSERVRFGLLAWNILMVALLVSRAAAMLISRRISWHEAARQIEEKNSHFNQRLQTAVSQILSPADLRGSGQLLDSVVEEVEREIAQNGGRRLIPMGFIIRPWLAALAGLVIAAGLWQIPILGSPQLFARAIAPWADIPPVTTTQLIVTPGDSAVMLGQSLAVHVRAGRLPNESPTISVSTDGSVWQSDAMSPGSGESFSFTIPRINGDLHYFVSGGDAVSQTYSVRALHEPAATEFHVHYDYPPYSRKSSLDLINGDGVFEAPTGTHATVQVVCSEEVKSAVLTANDQRTQLTPTSDPKIWQAVFDIQKEQRIGLDLRSAAGVNGKGPDSMAIHAIVDLPPAIKFIQPAGDLQLLPDDDVHVGCEAADDYAVIYAGLRATVSGKPMREFPMDLAGPPALCHGSISLDLSQLDVQIGDVIRLTLVARDSGGHQTVSTQERLIIVSPWATDSARRQRAGEFRNAAALAGAMAGGLDSTIRGSGPEGLSLAADSSLLLRLSLMRIAPHAQTPDMSRALTRWVDYSQQLVWQINRVKTDSKPPADLLKDLQNKSKYLQQALQTVADGESAQVARAENLDLQAAQKTAPRDARAVTARRRLLDDITALAVVLNLNAGASDFVERLEATEKQSEGLLLKQTFIDYASEANVWLGKLPARPEDDAGMSQRMSVAAQAEALLPDSSAMRARDLDLAGRAAPAIAKANPAIRKLYAPAIDAMQREEFLDTQSKQKASTQQVAKIHSDAEEARKKLAEWAGLKEVPQTQPSVAGAPIVLPADLLTAALSANAELAKALANAAQKTDLGKNITVKNLSEADVQKLEQLVDQQNKLNADTASAQISATPATKDQKQDLARRQQMIAQAIKQMDQQQKNSAGQNSSGQNSDNEKQNQSTRPSQSPPMQPDPKSSSPGRGNSSDGQTAASGGGGPSKNSGQNVSVKGNGSGRAKEMDAMQSASDQLAQMSAEISQAQKGGKPSAAAGSASTSSQAAGAMAQSLSTDAPHSAGAADSLNKVAPALQQLEQAKASGDKDAVRKAADNAQSAVKNAQQQLQKSQEQMIQNNPVESAHWYAQSAADELAKTPENADAQRARDDAVRARQDMALRSLGQAWQDASHEAALQRLADVPSMQAVLNPQLNSPMDQASLGLPGQTPAQIAAAARQWGRLQARQGDSLNSGLRESDPAGYEESLRAYFEALNGK